MVSRNTGVNSVCELSPRVIGVTCSGTMKHGMYCWPMRADKNVQWSKKYTHCCNAADWSVKAWMLVCLSFCLFYVCLYICWMKILCVCLYECFMPYLINCTVIMTLDHGRKIIWINKEGYQTSAFELCFERKNSRLFIGGLGFILGYFCSK